jgi:hypothetical protein
MVGEPRAEVVIFRYNLDPEKNTDTEYYLLEDVLRRERNLG